MKASRNTVRLHRPVDVPSDWEDVKEWTRWSLRMRRIAEVGLRIGCRCVALLLG